jgi:chromosome segregation ATPase
MAECPLRYNLFSEEDILEIFKSSFDIRLDKQRLIKPDRKMMVEVLSKFAESFKMDVQPIDIEACRGICSIGDLDTFYPLANLAREINALLVHTNFNDFSLADIVAPKRKRNQKIFSQLMALFISFYDMDIRWNEYHEQFQHLPEQKSIAMKKLSVMRGQIEEMSSELNKLQTHYKPLKEEHEKLSVKVQELKALGSRLGDDKSECKTRIAAEQEAVSEKEMQKSEIRNQIEMEKLKIVTCPEKIGESVRVKEGELNAIRDKYKQVRRETLELRNSLSEMERNEDELRRTQTLMAEGGELCGQIEGTILEMQSIDEQFKHYDLRIDDSQLTCQNLEKNLSVLETDLQQTANHHRTEMKPLLLHHNRLKGVAEGKRNDYNACKANKVDFSELDDERAAIRQQRDVIRQSYASSQDKYNTFADQMNEVCSELNL